MEQSLLNKSDGIKYRIVIALYGRISVSMSLPALP